MTNINLILIVFFLSSTVYAANCTDLVRTARDTASQKSAWQAVLKACGKSPAQSAEAWLALADIAQRNKQDEEAEQAYEKALALRHKTDDPSGLAETLNQYAEFYRARGNFNAAEPLYREALAVREQHLGADHLHTALSLNNLGLLLFKKGDYPEAEQVLQRALEIKQQHLGENALELTTSLNNLALVYTQTGAYAQAAPLYERALHIRERELPPTHPDIARSLNNLALLYLRLGEDQRAEKLYQRALSTREQVLGEDHPDVANTLHSLALIYQQRQQYAKAETFYLRAIDIWRAAYGENYPDIAVSLNNLAALVRAQGDTPRAEALYQHALAIQAKQLGEEHPAAATSLGNLAFLYSQAQSWQQAEPLYLRAMQIGIRDAAPERLWSIQHNFSQHLLRSKAPHAAVVFGKMAVNSLQGLRLNVHEMDEELRDTFLKDKTQVYELLANLLMEQQRLLEAQEILAMLKEEQYFDFVARDANADIRVIQAQYTPYEQTFVDAWQQIHNELTSLHAKLAHAKQTSEENALKTKLKQTWDTLTNLLLELKQVEAKPAEPQAPIIAETGLQSVLAKLGEHTAVLHYLPTTEHLQILLTTATSRTSHRVAVSRAVLNREILEFHSALQDPRQAPLEAAKRLYDWLLAPIAEELTDTEVLMVSLSGMLHYLPLAALHDGERYLAEHVAVVRYAEAARDTLTQTVKPETRAAGLGLTAALDGFPPLPGVASELHAVVRETPQQQGVIEGRVYLDRAFTRDALMQALDSEEYSLIHIASHFVFQAGTAESSFLLLGDGNRLTLDDIRKNFQFHEVELLTLSACDTAQGGSEGGEEIEGLSVLAQRQGAKAVLATLWPVSDEGTAQFMKDFYRHHVTEHLSKARALQMTQQGFIRAAREQNDARPYFYARPYYWAGFILMGNWL